MVEEIEEKTIRQYLLGELAEAEMSHFEERLMTDDELFEMLLVVEDELIDERAADELSAEEQTRFDTYFLATPQRRERLELAQALHDYAARPAPKPVDNPNSGAMSETMNLERSTNATERVVVDFPSLKKEIRPPRWYLGFAAAAVLLLTVGLGVWWIFFPESHPRSVAMRESDVRQGLQALNQAYREQRPTEARITAFDYAPPPPSIRGNQPERFDYVARDRAERILQDAVAEHSDAQSYHALGRLYLAERKFDEAIKQFDEALKRNTNDAQLESDIGAAYLEKGKAQGTTENGRKSLEEYEEGLKHLTRAIEMNDSLLQARFNRALLYGYMNRVQEAQDEWRNYLQKEPDSQWIDEANRRLRSLEK